MKEHDLIVLGGGPGGYVAAIRASQLGLNVACIDDNPQPGGTCLRIGCIPSKALLESSYKYYEAREHLAEHGVRVDGVQLDLKALLARKDRVVQTLCGGVQGLFKKHKIVHYQGRGRLDGPGKLVVRGADGEQALRAKHIIVATGSKPARVPGVELDGDRIGTSTEALAFPQVPKHLVVIGGGYIGVELGSVWKRLGAKVTVLEMLDRILPGTDTELAGKAKTLLEKQGLEFKLGVRVQQATKKKSGRCEVKIEGGETIECDRVLLAVGRVPNTEGIGLDTAKIETDRRGRIQVDENYRTSAEGIYAIGDCIAGPMLAHKASDEGVACVEKIVRGHGHVNYDAIPAVIFTHPEIASVGKSEEQLQEEGREYLKGTFPFRANGRARTLADIEGLVKILTDKRTDRILGVHVMGHSAGELIAEAVAAMEFGASAEDLALCVHSHPTLSEAVREAAMAVHGRQIHF